MRRSSLQTLLLSNLSDFKTKMALRVKKDRLKKNAKNGDLFGGSSKLMPTDDDGKAHCAVPLVSCVRRGEPLPTSAKVRGVKMSCTNEKCQYARQFIHSECFEQLENTLLKIISNLGSARGWTDIQRRHNLWEKKGLTLVQKNLRCHCGLGQMVRDASFYKKVDDTPNNAKTALADLKNKKKKKKELPKLNFGYNNAAPPADTSELYKKKFNELDSYFLSSHKDDSYEEEDSSVASTEISSINWQRNVETPRRTIANSSPRNSTLLAPRSLQPNPAAILATSTPWKPTQIAAVTPAIWKTVPSAAPTPISTPWKNRIQNDSPPQPAVLANGQHQQAGSQQARSDPPQSLEESSPVSLQHPKSLRNAALAAELSIPPPSWTNIVQSAVTTPSGNNNVNRKQAGNPKNSFYTLFGSSANFLLGEKIMADFYLPKNHQNQEPFS